MTFTIFKTLTNEAGNERVLITQREDGVASYRRQWLEPGGWGAIGVECGLYDSPETAESEARARIAWLIPQLH